MIQIIYMAIIQRNLIFVSKMFIKFRPSLRGIGGGYIYAKQYISFIDKETMVD